jgi:uncharacterized protein YoxC
MYSPVCPECKKINENVSGLCFFCGAEMRRLSEQNLTDISKTENIEQADIYKLPAKELPSVPFPAQLPQTPAQNASIKSASSIFKLKSIRVNQYLKNQSPVSIPIIILAVLLLLQGFFIIFINNELTILREDNNIKTLNNKIEKLTYEKDKLIRYKNTSYKDNNEKNGTSDITALENTHKELCKKFEELSKENESLKKQYENQFSTSKSTASSGYPAGNSGVNSLREEEVKNTELSKNYEMIKKKYEKLYRQNKEQKKQIEKLNEEKTALENEFKSYQVGIRIPNNRPGSIINRNIRGNGKDVVLHIGDSKDYVRKILGNPASIRKYSNFEYWKYDELRSVEFDNNGHLIDATNIKTNLSPDFDSIFN